MESVLKLEQALKQMILGNEPFWAKVKPETKDKIFSIIQRRSFWSRLEALVRLTTPVALVIMAVQGRETTLCDTARYWIYLAREISIVLPDLTQCFSDGFSQHVIASYNRRAVQLCSVTAILALFLNPVTRDAATAPFEALLKEVWFEIYTAYASLRCSCQYTSYSPFTYSFIKKSGRAHYESTRFWEISAEDPCCSAAALQRSLGTLQQPNR
jgi:hypothetical protein